MPPEMPPLEFEPVVKLLTPDRFGPHAARATAPTNAIDQGTDVAKVQDRLGHANVSTTRLYDHRKTKAEDSPTFKVSY